MAASNKPVAQNTPKFLKALRTDGNGAPKKPRKDEVDQVNKARTLGRTLLGTAVKRLSEALEATKTDYEKDDDGRMVPAGEVPDHAIRLRAVAEVCDRFGLPKKTEVETTDPYSAFLGEVAEAFKARA